MGFLAPLDRDRELLLGALTRALNQKADALEFQAPAGQRSGPGGGCEAAGQRQAGSGLAQEEMNHRSCEG